VSASEASQLEELTRVVFLIPQLETAEHDAFFDAVVTALRREFGGVTWSLEQDSVFRGWWIDPDTKQPTKNTNVLIFFDVNESKYDGNVTDYLIDLKRNLQDGMGEKIIWMTTHPVRRIAAFDLV